MSDQYPPPPSGDPNMPPSAPQGAPYSGAPAPPPKKRSVGKIIMIVLGALLLVCVLCVGGLFLFGKNLIDDFQNNPTTAQVGDCLGGEDLDREGTTGTLDVKKVDCADADATYKIVGRVPNKTVTDAQTDTSICSAFADAEKSVWLGEEGETLGAVFCLTPNK
jgi:hypothetical protein